MRQVASVYTVKLGAQDGASMLEYCLIAALIALVVITGVSYFGVRAKSTFCEAKWAIGGQPSVCPAGFLMDCEALQCIPE